MSRGIKDLRDLICVSRLTVRTSDDEEYVFSDEDFRPNTALSFSTCKDVQSTSSSNASDSGIGTTTVSPDIEGVQVSAKVSDNSKKKLVKKTKTVNGIKLGNNGVSDASRSQRSSIDMNEKKRTMFQRDRTHGAVLRDIDHLAQHMDEKVIMEMLERSHMALDRLKKWCRSGANWTHFCNFWLNSFPETSRTEIFYLEYTCFLDELSVVFLKALSNNQVQAEDLKMLCCAVLREYPDRLVDKRGSYLFLDYLQVLTSERKADYLHLLTDVRISTRNRQHAQWLLAIRSFGLINIWSAVINFFRQLVDNNALQIGVPVQLVDSTEVVSIFPSEIALSETIFQIVKYGYVEAMHYMIKTRKIQAIQFFDNHNRNLIFLAVTACQHRMLRYLLNCSVPANCAADTGNFPLHTAATLGDLDMVAMLVEVGRVDVNCCNPLCDNSTPLHLAVMYGHPKVVHYLLEHGASTSNLMAEQSCCDMAKDMGHTYIHKLLIHHQQMTQSDSVRLHVDNGTLLQDED